MSGPRIPLTRTRTRLLLIMLVPLLAYGLLARREYNARVEVRSIVSQIDGHIVTAQEALAATRSLNWEYRFAQMTVQGGAFGLEAPQIGEFLGIDLATEVSRYRSLTDANEITTKVLTAQNRADLATGRALIDNGTATPDSVRALYEGLKQPLDHLWRSEIDAAWALQRTVVTAVQGADDMLTTMTRLDASSRLYVASSAQLQHMSTIAIDRILGSFATDDQDRLESSAVAHDVALVALARATESYESAVLEVGATGLAASTLPWAETADRSDGTVDFDNAVAAELESATHGGSTSIDAVAELFRIGLSRDDALYTFLLARIRDAELASRELVMGTNVELNETVVEVAIVAALTGILTLLASRSIAKPLRRLEARAALLSSGDLQLEPLPTRGPREVAVATAGLNDAIANLHTIERQAEALAAGNTNAARDIVPAPGHLGTMMHASVARLTLSLGERDALEKRLAHEASHDALTGLLNRRALLDHLERCVERGDAVAVIFFDLDGFKQTNDGFGHGTGDAVLRVVADRLTRSAPPAAVSARFGGDEFVMVIDMADKPCDHAERTAKAVIDAIREPIAALAEQVQLGASAGIAVSAPGASAASLVQCADLALYRAKSIGGSVTIEFGEALRAELDRNLRIARELREAMDDDQLVVYYQPISRPAINGLHGVEALVRWRKPDGTLVPPDDFIPVAEESDLIVALDMTVMSRAAEQIAQWRRERYPDLRLSANISGRTLFSPGFVDNVVELLSDAGLPPTALTVELTETVLLTDLSLAAAQLAQLRALGIRVAIDDFGTGYTSIAQLRQLPIDCLKIDRSFVSNLEAERDRSIVDLVISVGHSLGCELVAEGVETIEQQAFLVQRGCELLQGYLISRPLDAGAFEATFPDASLAASGLRSGNHRHGSA
ncbi:MAG: putative bifunctional diguanylate cyclase/phosphodiesterase [Acidimicrobiia bacterium]